MNQAGKTVAVLFGGRSDEHAVSLQSAHAVLGALEKTAYHILPVGITRAGAWRLYRGPRAALPSGAWEEGDCVPVTLPPDPAVHGLVTGAGERVRLDAAFPVLHGKNGEDGTVQGLLALADIPCVGCGVLASAVCMDKDAAHRLAHEAGVAVPDSVVLRAAPDAAALRRLAQKPGLPLFVKPARGGSSFGVARVETAEALTNAVRCAFAHDTKVLVEAAVPGFEVGCAVRDVHGAPETGEVDEIELAHGFFDYREKYSLETARIHMPARLPDGERQRVRAAAKTVYRALACEGFARVDFFYTPQGQIIFNEVNTVPGFTAHSRFPAMMRGAGVGFDALVASLVREAVGV